jgi:hypothetical protein
LLPLLLSFLGVGFVLFFFDFGSLLLGDVAIFMTDYMSPTSCSPLSSGHSIQVQVIGRYVNLLTLSTRKRQIDRRRPAS